MQSNRPTDNLAAAKSILDQPAEDIGDHELAEASAHALAACAEHLGEIARILGRGVYVVQVDGF